MRYVTVFNAGSDPFRNWDFFLFGLIAVAIGVGLVFAPSRIFPPRMKDEFRIPFGIFYLLFASVWTVTAGASIVSEDLRASHDLAARNCTSVAGVVEDFHPAPWEGHSMESFTVAGVRFEYSDYVVSAGFNNTASHGGPIRQGLPVRICYRDGQILRLDVASASQGNVR
jgi:hypothetical protein